MAARSNADLYRHTPDGQRKGPWSFDEHRAFMRRLRDHGANSDWGLFSAGVPHRVGYQCADYYRRLIEKGDVTDPHYNVSFSRTFGGAQDRRRFSYVVHRDRSGTFSPLPCAAARALAPPPAAPRPWIPPEGSFLGAVVDPGPGRAAADLARLPVPQLVPHGFVCCWVPSPSWVVPLLDTAHDAWHARLVETVAWVHDDGAGAAAKTDLFVFRRAGTPEKDLGRQRNCDVILSPEKPVAPVCDLVRQLLPAPPGRTAYVYVWGGATDALPPTWAAWSP